MPEDAIKQIQKGGSNSLQFQANVMNMGLSYADVKAIALDLFAENFLNLQAEARNVAYQRADEITSRYLKELETRRPDAIASASDPGLQRALFHVQEEFACSGDEALGSILVDLLIRRTIEPERSLLQLALDQAILTAPKLTSPQIASLSFSFFVKQVHHLEIPFDRGIEHLRHYLSVVVEALGEIATSQMDARHLEYAGCVSIVLDKSIGDSYLAMYPGLFSIGVPPTAINDRFLPAFVPHPTNAGSYVVPVVDELGLEQHLRTLGLEADLQGILQLITSYQQGGPKVEADLSENSDQLQALFSQWGLFKDAALTSVGVAIGHANLQRATKNYSDLSLWL